MSLADGRRLNATKYGAFAREIVFPGESIQEFRLLYRSLADELSVRGPFEEETVLTIAKLVWSKQRADRLCRAEVEKERAKRTTAWLEEFIYWLEHFDHVSNVLTRQVVDDAIDGFPQPYRDRFYKKLETKERNAERDISADRYAEMAKQYAERFLSSLSSNAEEEPSTPNYQTEMIMRVDAITTKYLSVSERIVAMIDRAFKRLAQIKAYKQIVDAQQTAPRAIEAERADA